MTIFLILSVSVFLGNVTVKDDSYRTVAHMEADGDITGESYRTIAHVEDDGDITEDLYRTVGHLDGPVGITEKRANAALWLLRVLSFH